MNYFWENLASHNKTLCAVGEDSLTYSGLVAAADHYFSLCNRSISIIVCRRNIPTLLGYIGCLRHRVVPLLLPDGLSKDHLNKYILRYQPKYLWAREDDIEAHWPCSVIASAFGYKLFLLRSVEYDIADDLGLLLSTSGSTADPKLVRLSYKNIQSNANAITKSLNITGDHRPISLLPFYYSFGLSVVNTHLNNGATIIFTEHSMTQREFWEHARRYQLTSFYGVPFHFEILKKLNLKRLKISTLSLIAQAGGKLSQDLKDSFFQLSQELNFKFYAMYGQTEATARMTYLPPDMYCKKYASVGKVIPGGEIVIYSQGINGIGEIVYYGDNVSLGYALHYSDFSLPDQNRGKLKTGDLGYLDGDGFLHITGRKQRVVKIFGNRVNLDHVETLVKDIAIESVVIGEDDVIKVLTVSDQLMKIRDYILSETTINSRALHVQAIDEISRMPSGKIDYAYLIKRYLKDGKMHFTL